MRRFGWLVMIAAMACAAGPEEAGPPSLAVEFSTPPGSGEPNLFVDGRGVLLTWHEPTANGSALRFAERVSGRWSEPRTVAADRPFFVNWADFPSMVRLTDGTLLVHWLEKVADSPYAYHVMVARSGDEGGTWSEPTPVHEDRSPTEHGFVSMLPMPDGQAALVWLDGQNTAGDGEHRGAMQVRATTLGPDGRPGVEWQVDDRTCDCCQTALIRMEDGLVVAYRDRSGEEIRDIAVSRLTDEGWSAPLHVGGDNWHFPACPVNGPALAANGDSLAVAWFTGADDDPRVNVAFSLDGGRSFGSGIRLDDGHTLGRVDMEFLPDGSLLVMWLDREGDEGRLTGRRVRPDGTLGPVTTVTETNPTRRSGFPRLVRAGTEILLAWTVVGDDGGVRVAALNGFGLPAATD